MRRGPWLAFAALLLGPGCSVLPSARSDAPTLHVLDARPAAAAAPARRALVLAVGTPRAAPALDSAAMLYVQQEHALERYATHRWADAPARLIAPLLTRTLDDTGAFSAVVPANGVPADLRLDTELLQLRQSFLVRPSRIELALRFQLVDLAARRVLATRYVEVDESAPTDDAPGGVAAANAALARALAQAAAWCIEQTAAPVPARPAQPQ
ncbi:MAG TPA: ABC-type transport auxiliary lipoprotein family protein [Burkholderiaceae bacterium]|nr:ABC-type transport auxiliary lipoprotein family protein [Burkholderiaceae bacterium]